ncbi:MAG: hypothetical protein GYA76_06725 [Verrucomicrobia bacterium]|jgi:hypothetical protein|nr:hypothetical protein [Verrucomicrobiota bacterium]
MKTLSRILVVAGIGAAAGGLAELLTPMLLAALPPTSPIKQAIELPLSAIEQLAKCFGKILDPEYRTLAPSDSSASYAVYLLVFFALVGAVLSVLVFLTVNLGLKFRSNSTAHSNALTPPSSRRY